MPAEWADEQIDAGASPIEARAAAFTALQTRAANRPQIRVTRSHDDPATIQRRASDALTFRAIGGKLAPEAAEYQHLSLLDHARAALDRAGISHRGMSNDEVLHRSLTTSDFPLVVGNVAGKVAGDAYEAAQSALRPLFRAKTLPDFKPSQSVRLTEVGRLEEITEAGEFTNTSRGEAGEGLQLRTFGKRLDLSRKLIINDDLGLFADTTAALGRAAAMTEADAFAELLTGSQALSDGLPLFHASRENTTEAGGALSIEMLSDLRLALRQQKLDDGVTPLSVEPRFLVVSPADETAAEQILAEVRAEAPFQVNPFSGKLQLLVEPRLAPGFVYLIGNPASVPIFNVAYLASARGPQIQRMEAWDTLGVSFRVWLDFGVGFAGWRGIVRAATE